MLGWGVTNVFLTDFALLYALVSCIPLNFPRELLLCKMCYQKYVINLPAGDFCLFSYSSVVGKPVEYFTGKSHFRNMFVSIFRRNIKECYIDGEGSMERIEGREGIVGRKCKKNDRQRSGESKMVKENEEIDR